MNDDNAIELSGVGLTIGGKRILEDINWRVGKGQKVAILGPNGCGKSTLLRVICGYLHPTTGYAKLLGERLGNVDIDVLRRRIGVVDPAGPFVPDGELSVLEVAVSGHFGHLCLDFDEPTPEQIRAAATALRSVGLGDEPAQRWGTLSSGEARRALLARANVANPALLILDEPTAGLDLPGREQLLRFVRKTDITTLLVTHHIEELAIGLDAVLLMAHGKVVAAGTANNTLTSENVSRAFGCKIDVVGSNGRWTWTIAEA